MYPITVQSLGLETRLQGVRVWGSVPDFEASGPVAEVLFFLVWLLAPGQLAAFVPMLDAVASCGG